jgi:ankyrin repeat protein
MYDLTEFPQTRQYLLFEAVDKGNINVVEQLLTSDTDVNQVRNGFNIIDWWWVEGATPFFFAAGKGNFDIMRLLVEAGADVNKADNDGATPLISVIGDGYGVNMVNWLVDNGADVNKANITNNTPLHWAAVSGDEDIIQLLLEKGAKINKTNDDGETPLLAATEEENIEAVQLLLEKGATVRIPDKQGRTPLTIAHNNGDNAMMELIQTHADQQIYAISQQQLQEPTKKNQSGSGNRVRKTYKSKKKRNRKKTKRFR